MDDDIAIKVEHVSKKFSRSLKRSMLYGVKDIGRNALGMGSKPEILRKQEFWAVDDVSFEVKKGEALGLIGPNGSGKSTLLKMLNGIYWPDKGRIQIKGSVGALIQVGAGFHPMLTGRENIYTNAAILGMTKNETDDKFDDIIKFADIGDFLDTPVKFYSSGMYVRLGFAVAIHCEPDVLLVDEVLAVGDTGFKIKCLNKMYNLAQDIAIVFVSHGMPYVSRLCSDAVLLNHGKTAFYGDVNKAIEGYFNMFSDDQGKIVVETEGSKITDIQVSAKKVGDYYELDYGEELTIEFNADINAKHKKFEIDLSFFTRDLQPVTKINLNQNRVFFDNLDRKMSISVSIPKVPFSPGIYYMQFNIWDVLTNEVICKHDRVIFLKIKGDDFAYSHIPTTLEGDWKIS